MRASKTALAAGVSVPLIYLATLAVGGWLAPDYSHLTQYASELGMSGSPSADFFNGGILLTAVTTMAGSVGLYIAARRESLSKLWPVLAGVSLGLFGVGLVFGALFPMPDPRHGGFGLGMGVHLAPLFLALALRSSTERTNLKRYLIATAILMAAFLLPMFGVGGLVTQANVGLFQRLYALMVFGWIGIASYALLRPGR